MFNFSYTWKFPPAMHKWSVWGVYLMHYHLLNVLSHEYARACRCLIPTQHLSTLLILDWHVRTAWQVPMGPPQDRPPALIACSAHQEPI